MPAAHRGLVPLRCCRPVVVLSSAGYRRWSACGSWHDGSRPQTCRTGMDAAEIEVFLTLAEELHFTRTAERLHLPQSRVSRLVASLERRVGGALFERTSRRVVLTPLG